MTQTPQQLPKRWLVPFPEKKSHMHPCQIACDGNQKMGYLLYYFLYEASWELERQNLEESCNVVVLTCKHEDILKKVNISEKTLIEFLKTFHEWGFVLNERYSKNYIVQADPIREAMYNPKSCSKKVNFTTLMTLEECCKVEAMLKQLQEVQLYNIALETKLEAALQRIEDLETKSCKVEANPEEGKLYNFSEGWIQAVSDALGIELPTRTIEKNLTKETIRDSFVETSDDVSDPNTEPDYFERETICPECGELTADPQACLHNFPIGSTTQGEQALDPVAVVDVTTGNSLSHESEHRANATTAPPTPLASHSSDTADLPPGQTEPTLQQMEMEQEAHDTVTTLTQQNTPKPAESPLADDVALTSSSGIQQVSPSQCDLKPSPPSTPGQRSGRSATSTPTGPDAAQVGQECYTTPEDWEAARTLFQEEIRARWAAWDRQQRQRHGGKWQTYEKQERLAWEIRHPKPVDEALEQACRDIYTKLATQWRGYEWDGKGAVINERKFIRCFVLKYRREFPDTVKLFEDIYIHLTTKHIKYSSDSYSTTVSASIIFHESNGVIQLWKKPKSQSNGHTPYTQNGHTKVTPIRSNTLPTFTEADYEQLKRMPV